MKPLLTLALALLAPLASAQILVAIDRTHEPLPLVVRDGETLKYDRFVDNHPDRPAVIVMSGGAITVNTAIRQPQELWERPGVGLGNWNGILWDGLSIDFSREDFKRSFFVLMGSGYIKANSVTSDGCVLALPEPDGTYGENSLVKLGYAKGRMGVMASGQKNLRVSITSWVGLLYNSGPAGHGFYANECRMGTRYMRCLDPIVTVLKSRGKAMAQNVRFDHVTAKFKGTHGVDYTCLDDENPCGALDAFQSSGRAWVKWKYPFLGTAMNHVFSGMRLGDGQAMFGVPPSYFGVKGEFDGTNCPDPTKPVVAVHVLSGKVASLGVKVKGKTDVYGAAAPLFPMEAVPIQKE